LGIAGPGFDFSDFNNAPTLTFTLGESNLHSPRSFFDGLVVDTTTGRILSGPRPTVPEPGPLVLFGCALLTLSLLLRARGSYRG
jgi:hypothetical protein